MYSQEDKTLFDKIRGKLRADNIDSTDLDGVKTCLDNCVCPGLYNFYLNNLARPGLDDELINIKEG